MKNKRYFLALNRMNHIGPRTVEKLLSRWPDLEEMFGLSFTELEKSGVPTRIARSIVDFDMSVIDTDLQWEQADGHFLLTWCDPEYPALLKEIHDPPVALYLRGDLSCLKGHAIAMVGTRNPSVTGSETAWQFAYELASKGVVVVSGLALGIDAQAHRGCLDAGGKTIAVMGTGIDYIYPQRHARLAGEIIKSGLLISEFPLKSPPVAGHFPRRNRIISGLSSSILVVEAAMRSGSLITARLALEQNRDVLAIPGSIHSPQSRGCHHLLQQGAKLVISCEDVLEESGVPHGLATMDHDWETLAGVNANLVKCIGYEMTTVDQILVRSGLTVETVVCELAELELQGIVRAVPGGYMRCKR